MYYLYHLLNLPKIELIIDKTYGPKKQESFSPEIGQGSLQMFTHYFLQCCTADSVVVVCS